MNETMTQTPIDTTSSANNRGVGVPGVMIVIERPSLQRKETGAGTTDEIDMRTAAGSGGSNNL